MSLPESLAAVGAWHGCLRTPSVASRRCETAGVSRENESRSRHVQRSNDTPNTGYKKRILSVECLDSYRPGGAEWAYLGGRGDKRPLIRKTFDKCPMPVWS